jgi:hypothetical protein
LAEAATKAHDASALLPNETGLADAVAVIEARATQAESDRQATAQLVAERKAAADGAAQAIASSEQEVRTALDQLAEKQEQLVTLCGTLDAQRQKHARDNEVAYEGEWRLDNLRSLAEYGKFIEQARSLAGSIASLNPDSVAARNEQSRLVQLLLETHKQIDTSRRDLLERWTEQASVAVLKSLSAEQLCWSLMQAAGVVEETRAALAAEWHQHQQQAQQAAAGSEGQNAAPAPQADPAGGEKETFVESKLEERLKPHMSTFVSLFGGEPGQPQQEVNATVDQALFLSNGDLVRGWLAPRDVSLTGRLAKIEDPIALADVLYMGVLNRRPSDDEAAELNAMIQQQGADRPAVILEVAWALLTSAEFRFNH